MSTVGMVHGGAVGDFVLAWHLLQAVRRQQRIEHAVAWARGGIAEIDAALWRCRRMYDVEACGLSALFQEHAEPPAQLAAELQRCALVLNLLTAPDTTLARRLAECSGGQVFSIETRPQDGSAEHITMQWVARLRARGLDVQEMAPGTLAVPDQRAREAHSTHVSQAGLPDRPIAVIHPGSGGKRKCWPLKSFLELRESLEARGFHCLLMTGPVEHESWSPRELETLRRYPAVEPNSLPEALRVVAAADLYVGNDAGMTHLAAGAGARTIAIFGETDPVVWRPLGARVEIAGTLGGWPRPAEVAALIGEHG